MDTNASVNSLASFHAVMGPQAVYSASLYSYTAFITFMLLNLKLRELIFAFVVHSQTISCQLVLIVFWCLPTWHYTQSSLKFGTALGGGGGGGGSKLRSGTKQTSLTFSLFLVSRNMKLCIQL